MYKLQKIRIDTFLLPLRHIVFYCILIIVTLTCLYYSITLSYLDLTLSIPNKKIYRYVYMYNNMYMYMYIPSAQQTNNSHRQRSNCSESKDFCGMWIRRF
jgi:hypothetical protein